jgi:hypothetical protein
MASITAPSITLRSTKGSPLTNAEVDANFSNISTQIALGQTAASYTAADVLAKLNTVTGYAAASGLNSDTLTFNSGARSAASTATANTIVARDGSGNFSATTITANLTGTASIAASLNYTVAISGGGTGATTQAGAQTALGVVPDVNVLAFSNTGKALKDLTSAADTAPYFTGAGTASTHSFTSYMRGVAGSADAATARSNLGLTINTNVQAYGAQLSALSGVTTGIAVLTGAGTAAGRTIVAGGGISVSNGDGTAGNPTISAAVTSVQGNTGAVIVSVPVTSVQGATGAVIVSSVSYASSAGSASYASIAGSAQGGWPYFLSQYGNNIGNYGGFLDSISNCGNGGTTGSTYSLQAVLTRNGNQVGVYMNCNCRCNC